MQTMFMHIMCTYVHHVYALRSIRSSCELQTEPAAAPAPSGAAESPSTSPDIGILVARWLRIGCALFRNILKYFDMELRWQWWLSDADADLMTFGTWEWGDASAWKYRNRQVRIKCDAFHCTWGTAKRWRSDRRCGKNAVSQLEFRVKMLMWL